MNLDSMREMINNFSNKLRGLQSSARQTDRNGGDSTIETDVNPVSTTVEVVVSHPRIFRVKRTMSINTRDQIKRYTLSSDKRVFFPDLTSVPFGY